MKNATFFLILLAITSTHSALFAQKNDSNPSVDATINRPKLIIGIVVDQMRYDYLYRYWDKYGSGGFKRLVNQGFSCENTHYNYVPTYTGPGHAAIFTGTSPATNGIIGNEWF